MRPSHFLHVVSLAVVAALPACGSGDAKKEAPAAAQPPATAAQPPAPAQPAQQAAAPVQPAQQLAPATPPPAAAPAVGGHSAVPTLEEWNGVGEVTVRGSSALECETKGVREWIRISCRGDSRERGKPTSVTVTRGGGAEVFTFASGGVASLVFRFEVGTDIEANFGWERGGTHRFVSQWPRGAPKPTAYGQFF
jgi:nucleoid-associated protein YgaU